MDNQNNDGPTRSSIPAAPTLPTTLNALRMTYMNLFNQILDSSIHINCMCKTTSKINNKENENNINNNKQSLEGSNLKNVFESQNFMSDDEDSESEEYSLNKTSDNDQNDVEMIDYLNTNETRLYDLDYTNQSSNNVRLNKICDLSCFENMRYVHFVLKKCFFQLNENNRNELTKRFNNLWSNFKFLSKYPESCDYYGTTIFHYAAADNHLELLKHSLLKYPRGVKCIDSKGMTPLMRAVQRNSYECVKFLLNETESDLNGSSQSTYTPLWFAVSNGYDNLAHLLLNYNASPSIINKSIGASNFGFEPLELIIRREDLSGIHEPRASTSQNQPALTSYLFSPLRASIVYSRYEIMSMLLEFDANVYELFGATSSSSNLTKSNEEYVNSLKFFNRQFGKTDEKVDYDMYLNKINDFIDNPNVYRRMFIEFIKNIIFKINSNLNLVDKLYDYLNSMNKNSVNYIIKMTRIIEMEEENEIELNWTDYVNIISDFMNSLDTFLNLDPENMFSFNNQLNPGMNNNILKSMYHKNLLEFSIILINKFFKPKSLKELCRFNLRKRIFKVIKSKSLRYKDNFLKLDHLFEFVNTLDLPTHLKSYLLFNKCN